MFRKIHKAIAKLENQNNELRANILDLERWKRRGEVEKEWQNRGFTLFSDSHPPRDTPILIKTWEWYSKNSNVGISERFMDKWDSSTLYSSINMPPFAWRKICNTTKK